MSCVRLDDRREEPLPGGRSLLVLRLTREDLHARVIADQDIGLGRCGTEVKIDWQQCIRHNFGSLPLHRFRQGHTRILLHPGETMKRQTRPIFRHHHRHIRGGIVLLGGHAFR